MIDTGEIYVQAGNGGDGFLSFRREKYVARGGPEGGDGGAGGSVYLVATTSENTLRRFQTNRRFRAGHGQPGSKSNKHGKSGGDIRIPVPVGTVARLNRDGAEEGPVDLVRDGQEALVAQGGSGGRGNARFVTPTNQEPLLREAGEPGEACFVRLEVKLIADVGVIGVPNAGKSSFVGRVTAASPRVAAYPFTTLEPQLGVVENRGKPVVLAEIPGLLEGAHLGVGLGHEFLRHAERTRLFLHLVDGGALDPLGDFRQVNEELAQYGAVLAERPQVVVINKSDTEETQAQLTEVRAGLRSIGVTPLVMSAATGDGVQAVLDRVLQALEASPQPEVPPPSAGQSLRRRRPGRMGHVERDEEGNFVVRWPAAERFVTLANVDDHRVVGQLLREFRRLGVTAALEAAGVGYGDIVQVGDWTFPWGEALQPA